ncbi:hypothetical protein GCM10010394_67960 [Streptomyces crystallinus]|uniref:Uncharacterized protein n=1 Tax=Streptomyces crystallinus TaxID=68191 RepID=A0ABN1H3B5_9ACTN
MIGHGVILPQPGTGAPGAPEWHGVSVFPARRVANPLRGKWGSVPDVTLPRTRRTRQTLRWATVAPLRPGG